MPMAGLCGSGKSTASITLFSIAVKFDFSTQKTPLKAIVDKRIIGTA
jgi:hypothetical protein